VETARSLGGRIIAEGIESAADAARMLNLGATLGQGWALGTPARLGEALVRAAAERPEPVTAQAPARQLAGPVRLAPVRPRAG
jgi:EAL domain-containing protein (putative c-di-GMP-specific phosphodiesterase class I)